MEKKLTRRQWAAAAGAVPALAAPQPAPQAAPQPEPDDLAVQRGAVKRNSEQLAKFPLDMAVEPAFSFKA